MKRLVVGTVLMLVALGLQFAMVVRVVDRDVLLSLAGYMGLFVGMGLALLGILGRIR